MALLQLFEPADGAIVPLLGKEYEAFLKGKFEPDGSRDLDRPRETVLRFRAQPGARVHLRDGDGEEYDIAYTGAEVRLSFLKTGKKYEWYVTDGDDRSETFSFTTQDAPVRWIYVPGIANARDIGGHMTRSGRRMAQGKLYRSSEWNSHEHLQPEGEELLTGVLRVRTEIDLRGMYETAWPGADTRRINWKQFPVNSYGMMFKGASADTAFELYRTLAREEIYPAFVHCWGGMDRTATVSAVLQALCGVPYEEIERDYVTSSFSHGGLRHPLFPGWPDLKALLTRYPDDEEGSARELLEDLGLAPYELDEIRRILLER